MDQGKKPSVDRPWLVPDANARLEQLIREGRIRSVLEFGSGGSTVFLANLDIDVVAIEHDACWASRVRRRLQARRLREVTVHHAAATASCSHAIYRGRDGRYYREYVRAGTAAARQRFAGAVDCVLVDGRARHACARATSRYVRPGGVMIVDDAERSAYAPIRAMLADLGWKRESLRWKRHRTDFWFRPPGNGSGGRTTVLVLSSDRRNGRINDLLHRGFFESCPLPMTWYGPAERGIVPYDSRRPLREVVSAVGAGLVIVNMRTRVERWLRPRALHRLGVPTAMVEVDYCYSGRNGRRQLTRYAPSDDWYARARFDHVFFRHKVDFERSGLPARSWLPFSNDPAVFRPRGERDVSVGFAGTVSPRRIYPARNAAIEALGKTIELRVRSIRGVAFAEFLSRCRLGLACGGRFHYDMAKHVQIPASGALLLTDVSRGTPDLLPDPRMYVAYRADGSDVFDKVESILSDPDQLRARAALAEKHCREHHVHARRWTQILTSLGIGRAAAPETV